MKDVQTGVSVKCTKKRHTNLDLNYASLQQTTFNKQCPTLF